MPLNFLRVQNFIADNPNGTPREVIARLECIKIPQLTILPFDLSFLFPHADVVPVYPMISGLSL